MISLMNKNNICNSKCHGLEPYLKYIEISTCWQPLRLTSFRQVPCMEKKCQCHVLKWFSSWAGSVHKKLPCWISDAEAGKSCHLLRRNSEQPRKHQQCRDVGSPATRDGSCVPRSRGAGHSLLSTRVGGGSGGGHRGAPQGASDLLFYWSQAVVAQGFTHNATNAWGDPPTTAAGIKARVVGVVADQEDLTRALRAKVRSCCGGAHSVTA